MTTKQTTAKPAAPTPDDAAEGAGLVRFTPLGSEDEIKLGVKMVKRFIAVPTKSGKTATDDDCIKFIALCQARKLNPFEGDAFLIGYDTKDGAKFNLITAHQAFLKRAELNAQYDGMESGIIVLRDKQVIDLTGDFYAPGDKVIGGWATVYFKNRSKPMHKRVRLERFQKPFGIWMDDAAGMICKCAEADALRSSFPTMLGGLYMKEEIAPKDDEEKVKKPIFKPKVTTTVDVPPAKAPEPETPIQRITKLCEESEIPIEVLIEFLDSLNMLPPDGASVLEDLHSDTLDHIINQWDEFKAKIIEVTQGPPGGDA